MNQTERIETPALELKKASVCLHFVEYDESLLDQDKYDPYPDCPVMRSMELDLLSYRFQIEKPLGSKCELKRQPITIVFPDRFDYSSEGRTMTLVCSQPLRRAEVVVSSTRFLRSGVKVWHVVFTPPENGAFSEFDIIKLIHLYDGRTEKTELNKKVYFRFDNGQDVVVAGLLQALLKPQPISLKHTELKAGTIEIVADVQTPQMIRHTDLLSTVRRARESGGGEEHRILKHWMSSDTPEGRALMAYCGVVTGIFDFDQIDDEETLDTLEPTFADSSAFLKIHRCTLICITEEDRAMEECRPGVGISPYLIIPHAALLHNETMVDVADRAMGTALGKKRSRLRHLQSAYERADLALNRFSLPDIFNYVTERSLFEKGSRCRGSDDKRVAVLANLKEIIDRIETKWRQRQERSQTALQVLLSLITVVELRESIFKMMGSSQPEIIQWAVLGALAAVFTMLIIGLGEFGLRK